MSGFWTAVILSVVSGVCYGGGAVAQRQLAEWLSEPLTYRVIVTVLIRQRLWWTALVLNSVGAVLHVVALAYGTLTVVQPLGLLALVFALPWSARLAARRVSRREWHGAVLTVIALSVMLVVAADTSGGSGLTQWGALLVLASTLGVVVLIAAVSRLPAPHWRCQLLAVAGGTAFGVASALTKAVIDSMAEHGIAGLAHAALPGVAVLAVAGVLLSQAAYRGVTVGAPLATLTMANPVAAVAVGIGFMGESYAGGAWGVGVALLTGIIALRGIFLLAVTVDDTGADRAPHEAAGQSAH